MLGDHISPGFGLGNELRLRKSKGFTPGYREFTVRCFLEQRHQQITPCPHENEAPHWRGMHVMKVCPGPLDLFRTPRVSP